jgi:hypothetical protein
MPMMDKKLDLNNLLINNYGRKTAQPGARTKGAYSIKQNNIAMSDWIASG